MFLREFLETLGLPVDELCATLWPVDRADRRRARAKRLEQSLERRFARLLRHRQRITRMRQRLAAEKKRALHLRSARIDSLEREQVNTRLDRCRASLASREAAYQESLTILLRGRRKLRSLQERARMATAASAD